MAFVAAEGRLDKEDRHPASSGYGVTVQGSGFGVYLGSRVSGCRALMLQVQKDMTVGVKKCQVLEHLRS